MRDSDYLRAWRKRMGYTQQQAADALGVSKSLLRSIEEDRRAFRRPLQLLCEALERERVTARPTP